MHRIELPSSIERSRYIVVLCAAKRHKGYFVSHPTFGEDPQIITQTDIDIVAALGMGTLNLSGGIAFEDAETAVWFKMKYL